MYNNCKNTCTFLEQAPTLNFGASDISTTVVDREVAAVIPVLGSGVAVRGIDVFFANGTSAEDGQRR
ncbi:MAG: hypothetical protein ACRD19_08535, partial [Terriglobia bacterium]